MNTPLPDSSTAARSSGRRPASNRAARTVSLTLVELRCSRAAIEIDCVRRLLRVAAGAVVAEESEFDGFELPPDALGEILQMADSRLDAVSESLDCVRLKAEPTDEERERVASHEKIMREIESGAARSKQP